MRRPAHLRSGASSSGDAWADRVRPGSAGPWRRMAPAVTRPVFGPRRPDCRDAAERSNSCARHTAPAEPGVAAGSSTPARRHPVDACGAARRPDPVVRCGHDNTIVPTWRRRSGPARRCLGGAIRVRPIAAGPPVARPSPAGRPVADRSPRSAAVPSAQTPEIRLAPPPSPPENPEADGKRRHRWRAMGILCGSAAPVRKRASPIRRRSAERGTAARL
jgi:hypothetical protein